MSGSPRSPQNADPRDEGGVLLDSRTKTRLPSLYRVIMLNDDFTPMDFVVFVLMKFFAKDERQALTIMLRVHKEGRSLVGVYAKSIAETKVARVHAFAKEHGHPLKCVCEREEGHADGEL
ncbi:MAG: ATP-dependent Clp protease adapter ClpS [Silvanigrellales bacterium]|nr:ATP-dependent Clp protease adapter ClpS [Silvanigrellales bacterium]